MNSLLRTTAIIEQCEGLLSNSDIRGSPVESYLVQHALIVLCAEIQQEIYEIVRARAAQAEDNQLESFVLSASKRVLRSVGKSDLSSFVGHFGGAEKEKFNRLVDDYEVTKYNNAVSNRHDIAHKNGVQVTFSELKEAVSAASKILQALALSIEAIAHDGKTG
ncbi:MAG: HEPN domain-containing protein [Alphaproteobacteria bacterium]